MRKGLYLKQREDVTDCPVKGGKTKSKEKWSCVPCRGKGSRGHIQKAQTIVLTSSNLVEDVDEAATLLWTGQVVMKRNLMCCCYMKHGKARQNDPFNRSQLFRQKSKIRRCVEYQKSVTFSGKKNKINNQRPEKECRLGDEFYSGPAGMSQQLIEARWLRKSDVRITGSPTWAYNSYNSAGN